MTKYIRSDNYRMKIGIDGNEANINRRVGVNMYAYELLWALHDLNAPYDFVIYLKNSPSDDLPRPRKGWTYKVLPGKGVWIITKLMPTLLLEKDKPDIFFTPSHYVPPLSPQPRVCSIMDLGYLKFSGQFKKYDYWQLRLWSAWSILTSKKVLAISESTKEEIVRHYPSAKNKVIVTPLAYDEKRFRKDLSSDTVESVKEKYGISGDYALFISTLKPSKNVEGLIEAWKVAVKVFPRVKLVIAGKKGWLYESIFRKVRDNQLESNIIFTDFISEADKPFLIKGARVFVLPSFWEGFGLDPLYAMACGVPVVVSDKGSLPEVVNGAGLLIDPYDNSQIADAIIKVLSMDKNEYNKLVEKGLTQARKFSWEKTARKTLEVMEDAIH